MQGAIFPIREISTYNGRNWTIRGRVTMKSAVRTFTNDRGSGKVFSVDLLDKDGGEIKASFFNQSVEKFFDLIEAGKIYTFSKGNVKVANKRFSTSKHNYEINFDADAVIAESEEGGEKIDTVKYSFSKIRDISSKNLPCTIDLVAMVKEAKPVGKIQPKNSSEELTRRTITVVDSSECAIEITLWQDQATKLDFDTLAKPVVVAFKGLSIKEYNGGRTLSSMQQTLMALVEDADVAPEMFSWAHSSPSVGEYFNLSATAGNSATPGSEARAGNSSNAVTISEMKEECKRGFFGDKGIFFELVAKLSFISTKGKDSEIPIFYSACSACNRKLGDDNRCFACDKIVAAPKLKYLLRAQFVDHTDQGYLSVFDAQALPILKRSVEDVLESAKKNSTIGEELKKSYFERDFLLRVKATGQEFKGEIRPRMTVIAADPIDHVARGRRLVKKILEKIGPDREVAPLPTIAEADKENDIHMSSPDNKRMRMEETTAE